MREIKFRAWDKKFSMMHYEFNVFSNGFKVPSNPTMIEHLGVDDFIVRWDSDRAVLMQYTGLKDKNGKEIYEGDIVKADYGLGCRHGKPYAEEVVFEEFFYLKAECRISDNIEVIGNIYENEDLL